MNFIKWLVEIGVIVIPDDEQDKTQANKSYFNQDNSANSAKNDKYINYNLESEKDLNKPRSWLDKILFSCIGNNVNNNVNGKSEKIDLELRKNNDLIIFKTPKKPKSFLNKMLFSCVEQNENNNTQENYQTLLDNQL